MITEEHYQNYKNQEARFKTTRFTGGHIIELRDETFIRGKIITQKLEDHVVIESIDGNLDVFSMNEVSKISSKSQTIELKDGSVIRGRIIEQTPEGHVVIDSIDGSLDVFSMNEVNKITSASQTIELKDGAVIRGRIIEPTPGEHVVLRTLDGKLFVRSMKDIKEITPETQTLVSSAGPKNPGLAFGLSLIHPGLGQYYNEQYAKGTFFLVAEWCALIVMLHANKDNDNAVTFYSTGPSEDNIVLGVVGFIGYTVIRVTAAFDARSSAKEINVKHKSLNALRRIKPLDSPTDLGVTVSWKF